MISFKFTRATSVLDCRYKYFQTGRAENVMSIKISTLLKKIDLLNSKENASVIIDFYDYMRDKGSSENHIINNLKVII